MECKIWKKKYKNNTLTQQQIEDLDTASTLKLTKLAQSYRDTKLDLFGEMIRVRSKIGQRESAGELLFSDDDNDECQLMNTMMTVVFDAFDTDSDKKLNYTEWCRMVKELGLRRLNLPFLWQQINQDIGLIPSHEASLSNGSYGTYIYPEFDGFKEILHGPKEIIETLRWCAYARSIAKDNEDEDFAERYGLYDKKAIQKAFTLLYKLYGHAQQIVCLGVPSEEEVYDAILEAVPSFDVDIASVIYNFSTLTGQHIIHVSWHKIQWLNLVEDQAGLWNVYDRKRTDQYYELFYLSKQDEKGYMDTTINIQMCGDRAKCDAKITKLQSGNFFAFSCVELEETANPQQRWCLGQCGSYIPDFSFTLKEYAILIGKVLAFHGLNPKLCHYIYIGVGVKHGRKEKSKIVDAFNEKYSAHARFRPHNEKKKSMQMFNDILNFS